MARYIKVPTEVIFVMRGLYELGIPIATLSKKFSLDPKTVRRVVLHQGGYKLTNEEIIADLDRVLAEWEALGEYSLAQVLGRDMRRRHEYLRAKVDEIQDILHPVTTLVDKYREGWQ